MPTSSISFLVVDLSMVAIRSARAKLQRYQAIVGIGSEAAPLRLEDMAKVICWWPTVEAAEAPEDTLKQHFWRWASSSLMIDWVFGWDFG
jgi:hypothetical protein